MEFCASLFKGMHLYEINIKNHKILERFRKNFLSHIYLFNEEVDNTNMKTFVFQFKKIINIFFFLAKDLDFECLDQIKRQCIFILKQNKLNIFDEKSLYKAYNNGQEEIKDSEENMLTLKDNRSDIMSNNSKNEIYNKIYNNIKKNKNSNINDDINIFNKEMNKSLISLYFAFFRLFGVDTFYMFKNEENDLVINYLYNFTDLNLLKKLKFTKKIFHQQLFRAKAKNNFIPIFTQRILHRPLRSLQYFIPKMQFNNNRI